MIVRQQGKSVASEEATTVAQVCELLEIPYRQSWLEGLRDPLEPATTSLVVSPAAAVAIEDWFGFGASVLKPVRRTEDATEVGRLQLWPSISILVSRWARDPSAPPTAPLRRRLHPEPYLYVAPWEAGDKSSSFWNDPTFNGASLSYRTLLEADDQHTAARALFEHGFRLLS